MNNEEYYSGAILNRESERAQIFPDVHSVTKITRMNVYGRDRIIRELSTSQDP